jgi:VanZ family protein
VIARVLDWHAQRSARFWWVFAVLWAGVIFYFSAQSDLTIVPDALLDFVLRKIAHFTVFGVLALLVWSALRASGVNRAWLWAIAIAGAYAVSDELHQAYVEGRHPAPTDVMIDTAGAVVFVWLAEQVTRRWQQRRS